MIYCIGAYRPDGTLDSIKVGHTVRCPACVAATAGREAEASEK